MSEAQLGLCSPPHLDKDGTARPPVWLGPIELVGGWLVRPSPGIWESSLLSSSASLANFWGTFPMTGRPLPSPFLPASTGLQGTQRLQGEFGGGDLCLPRGWVLSDLHLTLWPLHLTGREGQARHRWCGWHEGNPQAGERAGGKGHGSGKGWWAKPVIPPDISM